MKTKYTPGTPDGMVGKTYKVEVIGLKIVQVKYTELPLIKEVRIKYKDGETEWIDGMKFFNDTDSKDIIQFI